MTPPPVWWLFGAAVLALAAGVAGLVVRVGDYLANPRAIDSDSGFPVFRVDGGYVSYRPFEAGIEPTVIGVGIALLAASVFVAAAVWRPRA